MKIEIVEELNADFRGSIEHQGSKGQYGAQEIHAGLICLHCAEPMTRDIQLELFELALDELLDEPDLVSQVLEVTLETENQIRIVRQALPET